MTTSAEASNRSFPENPRRRARWRARRLPENRQPLPAYGHSAAPGSELGADMPVEHGNALLPSDGELGGAGHPPRNAEAIKRFLAEAHDVARLVDEHVTR